MRFRLLRRRLTISAPRMAVRSALAWPFRWVMLALAFGFCAAIALWAFELGRNLAGLDRNDKQELAQLRDEVRKLRSEHDEAVSVANTSGSLLTAEKSAQEHLVAQVKQLQIENQALRDDLGFFERLNPVSGAEGIVIRGLQVDLISPTQLRWQILFIQPVKNAPEFSGRLELAFSGTLHGKPWGMPLPDGAQLVQLKQYRRMEGFVSLPPQTVVKSVSAKLTDGTTTRAFQTTKL
ncbi:MAG: DUF6776 family protein [Polaromonas sp.]